MKIKTSNYNITIIQTVYRRYESTQYRLQIDSLINNFKVSVTSKTMETISK